MSSHPSFDDFIVRPENEIADFRNSNEVLPLGDRRDGRFYRYTPKIKLAVRVAIAVGRPLLLLGPSGCGKSSLVFNLARLMKRRYYEFVVQARTQAQELLYRFDAIRRLGEAQASAAVHKSTEYWRSYHPFIEPGPLWWVYDPKSALLRGANEEFPEGKPPVDPGRWPDDFLPPKDRPNETPQSLAPAVVLIDEIDKAEPDFPNNLLVPLGSQEFSIEETGDVITLGSSNPITSLEAPLIIITSNRERELPDAFIRRCIVLELELPSKEDLAFLALEAFQLTDESEAARIDAIADKLVELRGEEGLNTAEFLDVVRAIRSLNAEESLWEELILHTTWTTVAEGVVG